MSAVVDKNIDCSEVKDTRKKAAHGSYENQKPLDLHVSISHVSMYITYNLIRLIEEGDDRVEKKENGIKKSRPEVNVLVAHQLD